MRVTVAMICMVIWGITVSWAGDGAVNPAELLETYVEALNAGDVGAEIALFSDHQQVASVIDGRVAVGVTAIRQSLQAQGYGALVIRSARIRNLGNESWVIFATLGPTKGSLEFPGDDTVLLTLVGETDGDVVQIVHQHVTTIARGGLTPP